MSVEAKLAELGIALPAPFEYPSPNRTGCVQVGTLLFASGHPPSEALGAKINGKVDGDISEEDAHFAAAPAPSTSSPRSNSTPAVSTASSGWSRSQAW